MNNIRSPASDRIKAEVKYEKVSFWCWQVFVAVSLFAFVTCIFSIGGFSVGGCEVRFRFINKMRSSIIL